MKLSIVTPNYNYGRFLRKALESVLAQTDAPGAPEIEHIVIDGGSTDDSVQILERWDSFVRGTAAAKESRYSFQFVSEPDNGQTDAINKGLRRATGDIVAWLNADEYYLPGKLTLVAAHFAKHPEADFVYGEPLFVKEDCTPIRVKRAHRFSFFVLAAHLTFIASCCAFWRRRVLDAGHYLDPSFRVNMDGEYYCRLAKAGYRFRFLPQTIAAFAWHDGNVSRAQRERRAEERRMIQRQYLRLPAWLLKREDAVYRFLSHIGWRWRHFLILSRYFTEGKLYLK